VPVSVVFTGDWLLVTEFPNLSTYYFPIFEYFPDLLRRNKFPGDITCGETPDPIPNSEAKLTRPMVVLTGESR
jgi:hypothetical protein